MIKAIKKTQLELSYILPNIKNLKDREIIVFMIGNNESLTYKEFITN